MLAFIGYNVQWPWRIFGPGFAAAGGLDCAGLGTQPGIRGLISAGLGSALEWRTWRGKAAKAADKRRLKTRAWIRGPELEETIWFCGLWPGIMGSRIRGPGWSLLWAVEERKRKKTKKENEK